MRNNTYIHDILIKVLVDLLSGLYVSTILIIFRCTTLINRTVTEEKNGFDQGKSRMFSSKLVFYWHRVVTLNDKLLVDKGLLVHRNPKHKIEFAEILKSAKDLLLWYWVVWYLGTSIMVWVPYAINLSWVPLMKYHFPGKLGAFIAQREFQTSYIANRWCSYTVWHFQHIHHNNGIKWLLGLRPRLCVHVCISRPGLSVTQSILIYAYHWCVMWTKREGTDKSQGSGERAHAADESWSWNRLTSHRYDTT